MTLEELVVGLLLSRVNLKQPKNRFNPDHAQLSNLNTKVNLLSLNDCIILFCDWIIKICDIMSFCSDLTNASCFLFVLFNDWFDAFRI